MVTQPDAVDVRFGSLADIGSAQVHVRFGPIADMCGAKGNVRYGPIADIALASRLKIKRPPTEAASIDGERKND